MPYNGSGTFTLYSPGNPVVTGTTISSTWANNTLTDLATGLSTALTKDGQTTPTANIPMGGFKLTGLAAGSASGDSVRYGQLGSLAFFSGAVTNFNLIGGYLEWSVSGNALTVAVKANSGSDPSASEPVLYAVRDATAATAAPVFRTLTAALSLTVPDTALLGTFNSTAFRLWAVIFNDSGTDRLGVINCASLSANAGSGYNVTGIYPLAGWGIASSTAVGTGSDSAATFYTESAVTSKAYTVAGYATWESGLATAGTWASTPTREQLWGLGLALPGQTIQVARTDTGAVATGTATIPLDDSIPQSGEGDQYLSQAITPTSASNALRTKSGLLLSNSATSVVYTGALFRDSVANSLATVNSLESTADFGKYLVIDTLILSGSASATTMKVRAGGQTPGTTTFNGRLAARLYGGVANSYIEVVEVMA